MIEYALAALDRGFFVHPLAPGTKVPPRGTNGTKGSSNDITVVEQWWKEYPDANIGINTGLSGLVVIDIDIPKDPNYNPDIGDISTLFGFDAWTVMVQNAIGWDKPEPRTYEVSTPSGGLHLYWQANEALPMKTVAGVFRPGIDVRAVKGSIVGAGSVTPTGTYEITKDITPKPLPTWLRAELRKARIGISDVELAAKPRVVRDPVKNGGNYGQAALDGELDTLAATPIGAGLRNAALNKAAFKLRKYVEDGRLSAGQVADSLYNCATGKLNMEHNEVVRTIASGLNLKVSDV